MMNRLIEVYPLLPLWAKVATWLILIFAVFGFLTVAMGIILMARDEDRWNE